MRQEHVKRITDFECRAPAGELMDPRHLNVQGAKLPTITHVKDRSSDDDERASALAITRHQDFHALVVGSERPGDPECGMRIAPGRLKDNQRLVVARALFQQRAQALIAFDGYGARVTHHVERRYQRLEDWCVGGDAIG